MRKKIKLKESGVQIVRGRVSRMAPWYPRILRRICLMGASKSSTWGDGYTLDFALLVEKKV